MSLANIITNAQHLYRFKKKQAPLKILFTEECLDSGLKNDIIAGFRVPVKTKTRIITWKPLCNRKPNHRKRLPF